MTYCYVCNNNGYRLIHKSGDPVPDCAQTKFSKVTYGSTVYETCGCRNFVVPASSYIKID